MRPLLTASLLAALACGSTTGDGDPSRSGPGPAGPRPTSGFFPPDAVWYRDVSTAALDPQSAAVIAYLDRAGWGLGRMQIDFSITVLEADTTTPLRAFTPTEDHFRPLPNATIHAREYVHPATHGTRATSGPPDAPPYGTRLRLRADYPLATLPNEGARTVARAMQRYGMLLADAGRVALTARSDRFARARWDGLLGPLDLAAIRPGDFQMIAAGERIPVTNDCIRNP